MPAIRAEIILSRRQSQMDKFSFYHWFMVIYHVVNVALALLLARYLIRTRQVGRSADRRTLMLSAVVFVESVNFVWLSHFADGLFGMKGQGMELTILHLCIFGPLFLCACVMCFFATECRFLCACLNFSFLAFGGLSVLLG